MEPAVPEDIGAAARQVRRVAAPTPRVALAIAAGALLVVIALLAGGAIKPFLLGVLLVYLLGPLVERLASVGIPRGLAVLIVFVMGLAVVTVVGAIALAPLITQLQLFIKDLPQIATDLRKAVVDFYQGLRLASDVREAIDGALQNASVGLGRIDIGGILSPIVSSIVGLLSTITAYAILPAWLFFLLKDRMRLANSLEAALPPRWRGDVFALFAIANRVFGNWVRGQLVLGATVGILSYAGLMLLSTYVDPVFGRYAVLLALIAGMLELVPFIGPIIAAIPAVLIGLTAGPGGFVAALALYAAIQLLENNLLVPKIQGDAVELHPSAVMLALVIGASLGGILGAIVSLPIAAASRDIFRYAFNRVGDPPASVDASLARISPRLTKTVRRSAVDASNGQGSRPAATPGPGGGPDTAEPRSRAQDPSPAQEPTG
jgi:predicted PurR-regulated permease PerM